MNPQYAYGWAVPVLCGYLLFRKAEILKAETLKGGETKAEIGKAETGKAENKKQKGEIGKQKAETANAETLKTGTFRISVFQRFSLFLLAFLYLPTRLIQEANPEWRLVSWALATEVIGLTLLFLPAALSGLRTFTSARSASFQFSAFNFSGFIFPICFFLVAVPWPTFIEAPVTQGLARANTDVAVEVLGAIGVPAVQHGNVIEVGSGAVGVDDACSGIRSLQATLMISLFLGEFYALSAGRRVVCVLIGFALSFLFNVARTTLLTWVAARKGPGAIAAWHDPAGVTILVGCFLGLWLVAKGMRRGQSRKQKAEMGNAEKLKTEMLKSATEGEKAESREQKAEMGTAVCLVAWLVLVEGGTELWYRSHEWGVPKAAAWHVEFPRENPTFKELPFTDVTKRFLRYDEGRNGTWQEGEGRRWQAIFLRWNPGRVAIHLAKSHTPEVCLTAAGREVVGRSGLHLVSVRGLALPFRSYAVKDQRGPLHVFYCLWADRAAAQSFQTTRMTYANRLTPVMAGYRNSGQRSVEVAVWGISDQQEAEVALVQELEKMIRVEGQNAQR